MSVCPSYWWPWLSADRWQVQEQRFVYPESEKMVSVKSYNDVTIRYFVQPIWNHSVDLNLA